MTNDVLKFNALVGDIGHSLAGLADLEQNGSFPLSAPMPANDLADLIGGPANTWQPQNQDIVWLNALKLAVYARQLLTQSARFLDQTGDDVTARKVDLIIDTVDKQLHPAETCFRVYGRLLGKRNH